MTVQFIQLYKNKLTVLLAFFIAMVAVFSSRVEVIEAANPKLIICPVTIGTLPAGGSALLTALYYADSPSTPVCGVTPGWIDVTTKPETAWSSTNSSIVSVSSSDKGRVSAMGQGSAVISVQYAGLRMDIGVSSAGGPKEPPKAEPPKSPEEPAGPRIIICPSESPFFAPGDAQYLDAIYWSNFKGTPTCANTSAPGWVGVTTQAGWSSSDSSIATVSAGGFVKAIKPGAAIIKANYASISAGRGITVLGAGVPVPGLPGNGPTVVSAKFEACTIPVGKSTCSTTASWHIKNLVGYVDVGFYSNLSPKSDGTEIVFTRPGTYGMVYHDESVPPTTTSGFGPTVDIKCEAGSAWDGKICKAGSSSENPGTPEVPGVPGPRLILCPANVSSIVVNGSALLSAIYYNNTSVTPVCGVTPGWIDVTTKPETSWSSTNPNIISVESSDKGRVSAKGVGTAVISAKYGDKTVSRSMSVGQPGIATPIPLPPTTPKNVNELLTSFGQIDAEMLAWQAQINAQNNDKARAVQAMIEGVAMEIQKLQQKLSTPNNQSAVKLATNSISTASIYLRQTSSFLESGSYDKAQSLIVSVGALLVKADAIFDYNSTLDLE